jgi:peptidyl-prolyl cis-trans isomerase C
MEMRIHTIARKAWVFAVSMAVGIGAIAQSNVGVVNGVPVPAAMLEQVVKNNTRQDIQESAELRQAIRNELLIREVLAQEAVKRGLDRSEEAKNQWLLLRQNFLAELLLSDYMEKNPISLDDVRKEYDRQIKMLAGALQYKITGIVLATEGEAKMAMDRLKKGDRFEVVARDMSVDPSKQQGGDMGWFLADQIVPLISNVVVNLAKGSTVAAPIQTPTGWHVIRLNDTRPYVAPSFDEAKERVRQGLIQLQRATFINKLQSEAKILTSS